MIHTKSLIRRLAYVPWLLAFGLVLGWAGEAQAQTDIRLTVDKSTVREDAGATTIKVTATNYASTTATAASNVGAETYVILDVNGESPGNNDIGTDVSTTLAGFNTRYRINQTLSLIHISEPTRPY